MNDFVDDNERRKRRQKMSDRHCSWKFSSNFYWSVDTFKAKLPVSVAVVVPSHLSTCIVLSNDTETIKIISAAVVNINIVIHRRRRGQDTVAKEVSNSTLPLLTACLSHVYHNINTRSTINVIVRIDWITNNIDILLLF